MSENVALTILAILVIAALAWPIIQGIAVVAFIYRMIVGF